MYNSISSENISNTQILAHAQSYHQPLVGNTNGQTGGNDFLSPGLSHTDTTSIQNHCCCTLPANRLLLDNIKNISGNHPENLIINNTVARPLTSLNQCDVAPRRLNLSTTFTDLNNSDPLQAFILNPAVGGKGSDLFEAIACKDLPDSIRNLELDWKNKQIRNILGILSRELHSEDRERFYKICSGFKAVEDDYKMEGIVARDLSFLLNKYGKQALYRQVELFTECCRKTWYYHTPGHLGNTGDDDIFSPGAEACYVIIYKLINELTNPKQEWAGIVCDGLYFKDTCSALGATIKIDPNTQLSVASLNDTFESIFPKTENVLLHSFENDDAVSISSSGGMLKNIMNIFCCNV